MKKDNKNYEMEDFKKSQRQILYSIFLVGLVFIVKLFGGLLANSLALLSDSLHLVTDFISLLISLYGLRIAMRPANYKYTFGYYRHSILTALINNIFLILISFYILYKAVFRYLNPVPVESTAMIFFSTLGIIVNIIILLTLRGNSENMNVKSALLHFIGDAIGDASVLIGAIVIYFTGINLIDTLLSVILSILILRSAIKMAFECIKIFLEAAPNSISIEDVKNEIKSFYMVMDVKDVHIWSL
jgi:cobalt-zinc-cadmium efflux system protein